MKKNQILLLYSLFFKSSNKILKYSIGFLPLVIAFSFSAILFINNLSYSYKDYLLKSYIGTQGVLSVESENINYLSTLQKSLQSKQIKSSLKKELRADIVLKTTNFSFEKKVKFIVLEDEYLKNKFSLRGEAVIFNKILKNILGDVSNIDIKNPNKKEFINITNIKVIDTGFLVVEPLIFVGKKFFNKLKYNFKSYNILEIDTKLEQLNLCEELSYSLSETYASDMMIKNVLSQDKKTKIMFQNIEYIEYTVLIITVILAFVILTGALSIISKIKEKAISLLRIYGLSTNLISGSLTMLSGVLLAISIVLSYIIFLLMKQYFISTIGFGSDFFILLGSDVVIVILSIFIIFCIITYLWSNNKFRGKIGI